ncbi:methyl-accepting chemotaxis protein [Laribacter hongkongensis]|uniref:methyl-accepting chemotaxis protein n=1 Tax=Laribacter hongkongensis TaxID=168471 RepID=UPI001EFE7683|nr:methyl-accepting chemotaxis protein [Laribacter hongkongensis]MCG8995078.1 methyl-accepting chemotaxis protein [Laribacter hongkongensis]MCG9011189.1 methyl-accepting chemotaxis protein [Laribacter hongkongensis]MCG9023588.1 methyl-accepting chemotaxis protein [Laribacter hongkongensis]MCG9047181.1 methyl-accepting chemotaxis protein [Laribacter hongkongensis]MCG9074621.1 methyl-accepting chemotaxis protein [Laribacter hongkongensis]
MALPCGYFWLKLNKYKTKVKLVGKMFKTVKAQLVLGFGVLIMLMALLTAVGMHTVNKINGILTEITSVTAVKQRYAINFRGSVHDRSIAVRDLVLMDKASSQKITEEIGRLDNAYQQAATGMKEMEARSSQLSDEEKSMLEKIVRSEKDTAPVIRSIISAIANGENANAQMILTSSAAPLFVDWLKNINQFIDFQESKNSRLTDEAKKIADDFASLMLTLSIVTALFGIAVAYLIIKNLFDNLGGEPANAARVVNRIASGDLTADSVASRNGSVLAAIYTMQEKLKNELFTIKSGSDDILRRAIEVEASSELAYEAAKTQHVLTEKSNRNIKEMHEGVMVISSMARLTEENSSLTEQLSEDGVKVMAESTTEIEKIFEVLNDSVNQIKVLHEKTSDIGKIANVIREIADQTNLLALNAAIEAARAGENGRGFAVVADEVRLLSEKTGHATSEISAVISVIGEETATAVQKMEHVTPQVKRGLELANGAQQKLGQIHTHARSSLESAEKVIAVVDQQIANADDLLKHVETISVKTEEALSAMQKNKEVAEKMKQLANQLDNSVAEFKTR